MYLISRCNAKRSVRHGHEQVGSDWAAAAVLIWQLVHSPAEQQHVCSSRCLHKCTWRKLQTGEKRYLLSKKNTPVIKVTSVQFIIQVRKVTFITQWADNSYFLFNLWHRWEKLCFAQFIRFMTVTNFFGQFPTVTIKWITSYNGMQHSMVNVKNTTVAKVIWFSAVY